MTNQYMGENLISNIDISIINLKLKIVQNTLKHNNISKLSKTMCNKTDIYFIRSEMSTLMDYGDFKF